MTVLIVFVVSVAVGWTWQEVRNHRLLGRSLLFLLRQQIADVRPPSIAELQDPNRDKGA